MKRTVFEKMGDFVLGRGFYIVLFLCVATIGVSGYYLFNSFDQEPQAPVTSPVTGNTEVTLPDPVKSVVTPQDDPEPVLLPKEEEQAPATVPAAPQPELPKKKAPAVFTWPVKGEVLAPFSVETLAFDATMGDWRIHPGVDLVAAVGTQVLAPAGGTVQAVFDDDLMGRTVVIDHGDGLQSALSNLSAETTVAAGEEVSTGTVIGVVGATAIAESAMDAHLHVEMTKDGDCVDPVAYYPPR